MLLQSCILDLIKKQKAEGKLTLKSINSKLLKIDLIKQNIRSKFAKYSKKLEKKYISELKKTSDSSYLKKEISPLIEKIDIEEEIVRLDSHIKTIFKLMRKNNNNLAVGSAALYKPTEDKPINAVSMKVSVYDNKYLPKLKKILLVL